eukprot:gene8881-9796_t
METVQKLLTQQHTDQHSSSSLSGRKRPLQDTTTTTSATTSATTTTTTSTTSKPSKKQKQKIVHESTWKFEVDYNDHFETPLQAYEDLHPVLTLLCETLGKTPADLTIYDPYYCQGQMVELMKSLGYTKVINRNRDFYEDIKRKNIPEHDILITNPPYSGEHKVRLLDFLHSNSRPFALLLPAYIVTKSYWKTFVESSSPRNDMLYLLPPDYYHYCHPEGTGKDLPPFYSAWLIGGLPPTVMERATAALRKYALSRVKSTRLPSKASSPGQQQQSVKAIPIHQLMVVRSVQEMVRLRIVTDNVRPNPKQRKKRQQQLQQTRGR